ncbi:MAG TPA: hypothetical protein VKA38_09990 [Draconibacterium sp.]|nr:hypothetical protein [Draconibacterium sp.]
MREKFENILLIAGSGQNVGKTTLACQIIQNVKEQKSTGVKITPHFHNPTTGLIKLAGAKSWKLFEETNTTTNKDSSLLLKSGAHKSYLIQTRPEALTAAFRELQKYLPENQPVVVESATLIEIIDPGFFVVVIPEGKRQKKDMESLLQKADLIVISDGKHFYPPSEKIIFNKKWMLR